MILKILKDACYQVLGFQHPLDTHPYGALTLGQNLSDLEILWKTFIIKLKEKKVGPLMKTFLLQRSREVCKINHAYQ